MAVNFRIVKHQNSDALHFKLLGDFDGTSADELVNTLLSCKRRHGKVFIHTSGLKSMHPFGAELFSRRCRRSIDLDVILTGEYAADMAFPHAGLI
jgi:anti-anti-sigma regulatory factor